MKIWAKIIKGEKILLDLIYETKNILNRENYSNALYAICRELDIDTPIDLDYYYNNFDEFNISKYNSTDFVDKVHFSHLVLENCSGK